MEDALILYIDRLDKEGEEVLAHSLTPDFLGVDESDLSFAHPVSVDGKAYLASDHLVLSLSLRTIATIPCTICNDPVDAAITINAFYHTQPIEEIKGATFDATGVVREAILLEAPHFVECGGKSCPRRSDIAKYVTDREVQFPFADLSEQTGE